ncbi:MAG: M13 family peptidase, partial [Alloprevotella sp.]
MKLKHLLPMMALTATTAFAQGLTTGIDKANMNLAVKPGTDFFEYAGGGWMKAHPLTPEFSRYGQFNALDEMNRNRLKSLIEEMAAKQAAPGTLEQKVGALYRLAMDSVRRNREGFTPIKPLLERVAKVEDKQTYFFLVNELGRQGVPAFMSVGCDADLKNAKMNLVQINQGGITLGERDYYLENDEATLKIRNAYKEYIKQLFTMTGDDAATAQKKMEAVLAIETRIAKASYSATQLRDVEGNYHKMTYLELVKNYPGIDWSTLFLLQGIPAVKEVSVNQPEPIHELEKIFAETSLDDLKAYLSFNVIRDASSALSDDFRAATFNFFGRTMQGSEQDRPRWKRAVGAVEGVLGMAIGKIYAEKYFPESSKKRMLELVKNLQVALSERIDQQTWMSA